tara:strand:- start:441 stop:968 length:528 start_codon:yes stop_codon:yes gene_type:complete
MRDKTKVKVERPEDHVQKKLFYHLYDAFLPIQLPWKSKYVSFETIVWASNQIDHMVIVGISKNALQLVSDGGFKRTTRGVVRGHKMGRVIRGERLFGDCRVDYENAFNFYRKQDQCVLITKAENGVKVDPKDWSHIFEFNRTDWVFPWRSPGYAANYSDEALEYLENLARTNRVI